jgi:predicted patatin/cPLA2 family phospholipase
MNAKMGLVLEGGGFRGLFTAGVLDYFLEKQIEFPYVIGVSMGASNGTNYLSKQIGRNLKVPYTFINDKRYMSFTRMLTKGELFGMDFIFDDIPNKLIPFDYKTFGSSKQKLVYVTTDCQTGEPYYVDNTNIHDSFLALRASTSLPFANKMVNLHKRQLLDGGISDSIPVKKALKDGCEKLVVILTQPQDYRKQAGKFNTIGKLKYKDYAHLIEKLNIRHQIYNNSLEELATLEKQGKAFVIRPDIQIPVSRTERNQAKLKIAYDMGYQHASLISHELEDFFR